MENLTSNFTPPDFKTTESEDKSYNGITTQTVLAELVACGDIRFVPKRETLTLTPNMLRIYKIFGDQNINSALKSIDALNKYLKTNAFLDNFGTDDIKRNLWRDQRMEKYGVAFNEVYINNQFTVNKITGVDGNLQLLALRAKKNGSVLQANYFSLLRDYMKPLINSNNPLNYRNRSEQGKIEIVRYIEDRIVELVNVINGDLRYTTAIKNAVESIPHY